MSLDPLRLRLLTQFADRGTVRAVGTAVSMSPSAVSAQLAALEREARTALFDRPGRRLVLTPAGRRLVDHARDILDRIDLAERDLGAHGATPIGPVRIAAFSSALSALVIPALAGLAVAHPDLQPVTVEQEPDESVPALLRGECDLALVADVGDASVPVDPTLARIPLTTDPVVVVVGPDEEPPGDLRGLAERPWVLDAPRGYLSDLVLRSCRQAGFEPRVVGRYRSFGLLLQQVEAGRAVTLLPQLAIDRRYRVRTAPLQPPVQRTIAVVVRSAVTPRPAVQAVIDALRGG